MAEKLVGKITHYYDKINVAVVELSAPLKVGDKIKIAKDDESFEQTVDSMQIEHESIKAAKKGDAIGMKVAQPARVNSQVFKITG